MQRFEMQNGSISISINNLLGLLVSVDKRSPLGLAIGWIIKAIQQLEMQNSSILISINSLLGLLPSVDKRSPLALAIGWTNNGQSQALDFSTSNGQTFSKFYLKNLTSVENTNSIFFWIIYYDRVLLKFSKHIFVDSTIHVYLLAIHQGLLVVAVFRWTKIWFLECCHMALVPIYSPT